MKVAVVILNWNGKDMMRNYLPSVVQNTSNECVRVVVADNGSTDGSVEMLREEFPEVGVILLDKNYGFAEGYNKALKQVEAKYYLLLNSDVKIIDKDWITPLLDCMESHTEVAACQPKLLSLKEPEKFEYAGAAGGFIDKYGYPFCRGRVFSNIEDDHSQYDDQIDVFWATGAALMVRSDDYWEVGGLDGRFFAHMEEIDLCWRLRSAGKRVVCIPNSRAYHLGGASLSQGNPRKTFLNFRNNLIMLYKNLPKEELRPVMRMRCFLDTVAALSFLLKGELGNFKAVLKARKEFTANKDIFWNDRQQNLKMTVDPHPYGRYGFSLLWQYHVRRRKTFELLTANLFNNKKPDLS